MPRLPRVYIEDSLYYVTCRSLPNQQIFKDKEDYTMYFGLLKKYKEELGVKVFAYTLLPTHLHLLCEVDSESSLSSLMHNLNSSYTKYFNGRYSRKGHLFRERFRAAIIQDNPKTLLNLTAHIHLNAERLNLELDALSYPYSSYKLYLDYEQHNDQGLEIKNEVSKILSALVGENYADFVHRATAKEEFKKLHRQLQRKKTVGSADFIEKVKKEIENQKAQNKIQSKADSRNSPKGLNKTTAFIMFVLTVAGVYVYFNYSKPQGQINKPVENTAQDKSLKGLDMTEWQIQLLRADGVVAANDVMSFKNHKFSSAYLEQFSFPRTNYSIAFKENVIIWETIQTAEQGTASWRGEVRDGNMNGIMSLRLKGKQPQDFTFKSLKYWRR